MRERVTALVVLLVVVMVGVGLALRALTLGDFMRAHQGEHQHHMLDLVATAVQERVELDRPVDQEFLDGLAAGEYRVVWTGPESREVVGVGQHYADGDPLPELDVSREVGDGSVRLQQSSVVIDQMVADNLRSGLVLGMMMTLLAAAIGLVLARLLSAPFQQLAHAAAALGRGRFELDLPETRIPEAVAIGDALRSSGRELQGRLERERVFTEHASHSLRTPLTSLRLELEELADRPGLTGEDRKSVGRVLGRLEAMSEMVAEVVQRARGSLIADGEVPLLGILDQTRNRWADRFADAGAPLEITTAGDLAVEFTPGPVEQLLDLLLTDLLERRHRPARVHVQVGDQGDLRLRIPLDPLPGPVCDGPTIDRARSLVEALSGRFVRHHEPAEFDVRLPRR